MDTFSYVEGVDYVVENGFWVWTSEFLEKRGFCCHSGCKNCPYQSKSVSELNKESEQNQ